MSCLCVPGDSRHLNEERGTLSAGQWEKNPQPGRWWSWAMDGPSYWGPLWWWAGNSRTRSHDSQSCHSGPTKVSSSSKPRKTQWGTLTQVLNSGTGARICAGSVENLLSQETNLLSWELGDAPPLLWAKIQLGNPWCASWSLTHDWWLRTGQEHKPLLHWWQSPWEMKCLGQWLCLHLLSQDCCYVAWEWQAQGARHGGMEGDVMPVLRQG